MRPPVHRQKIFEVWKEFCERLKLHTYGFDPRSGQYVVIDRDWKTDANHANRGELYLQHRFEGAPLDVEKAKDTVEHARLLSFDGAEHRRVQL